MCGAEAYPWSKSLTIGICAYLPRVCARLKLLALLLVPADSVVFPVELVPADSVLLAIVLVPDDSVLLANASILLPIL